MNETSTTPTTACAGSAPALPQPKPWIVIPKSLLLLLTKRVNFLRESRGQAYTRYDGQSYRIFRHVVMKTGPERPSQAGGVFEVWFHTHLPPRATILLSRVTLFGLLGMPGFRSKRWMFDPETQELGGVYEWDTVEHAEMYRQSFAMKFSQWRSRRFATRVYAGQVD